jgi:hypothetical protein
MIVYLANKTQFRADILSNRIESNIPQTGKRVDFIVTGTSHREAAPSPALAHE